MMPLHAAEPEGFLLDRPLSDGPFLGMSDSADAGSSGSGLLAAGHESGDTVHLSHRAVLYWLSPRLGFGFTVTAEGQDLLLSAKVAVACLGRMPSVGDVLDCSVEHRRGKSRVIRCQARQADGPFPSVHTGRVRSFDPRRGFGFLRLTDGSELFVGSQEMRRMGVRPPLRPGQSVTVVADRSVPGEAKIVRMVFASGYAPSASSEQRAAAASER